MNAYEIRVEKRSAYKAMVVFVFIAAQVVPAFLVLVGMPIFVYLIFALITTIGGSIAVINVWNANDMGRRTVERNLERVQGELSESRQAEAVLQGQVDDLQDRLSQNRMDLAGQAAAIASSQAAQFQVKCMDDLAEARGRFQREAETTILQTKADLGKQIADLNLMVEDLRAALANEVKTSKATNSLRDQDSILIAELRRTIEESKKNFDKSVVQLREQHAAEVEKVKTDAVAEYNRKNADAAQKARRDKLAEKLAPTAAPVPAEQTAQPVLAVVAPATSAPAASITHGQPARRSTKKGATTK